MMPRSRFDWRVLRLLCLFCCLALTAFAQNVVLVPIHGEINAKTAAQLHRSLATAQQENAPVVLDLDSFGGVLTHATAMRDEILASPQTVVVYVHPRAWSAGALLALAGQDLVMAPGSSIGAAEPIPATEKTIAAVRGEFAATAEQRNRSPELAAAMVDKTLGYPPYAAPGTILSLTEQQAQAAGLAQASAGDLTTLLAHYGWQNARLITVAPEWSDTLVGWLASPWLQTILIAIIFVSLFAEIKTAGFSGGGLVAFVAAALLFFGQWQTGNPSLLAALLLAGGVLIILGDIFFVMTGFVTAAGIALCVSGLFLLLGGSSAALYIIAGGLVLSIIVFWHLAKHLTTGRLWRRLTLSQRSDSASGYTSNDDYTFLTGHAGITATPLRPAGTAKIDGRPYDVVTQGEFIPRGTPIIVRRVIGNRIIVAARSDSENEL